MSNSSLVSYTRISPNSSARTKAISKITIHHAATVNASLEGMGNHFAKSSSQASSNYGIDSNGKIALYVDESRRAWTSSNAENDNVAVTIEVANSKGAPNWEVSDKALAALIELCADICKRNNIKQLNYTGTKAGNLTRHNMFAATACPGTYLQSKFPYIAAEVNKKLSGKVEEKAETAEVLYKVQTGAFANKENAEKLLKQLEAAGFNGFVKVEKK